MIKGWKTSSPFLREQGEVIKKVEVLACENSMKNESLSPLLSSFAIYGSVSSFSNQKSLQINQLKPTNERNIDDFFGEKYI